MIAITKPFIDDQIIKSVTNVLLSGHLVQGETVEAFEESLAKANATRFAVVVNSGTAALHTALFAAGIKSGDEVITTVFTFIATANAIIMTGAKPVFVDVDPDTFTLCSKEIEKKITKKTKAILTVDLYGQPCDYAEIKKIAKKHNLIIINDACQAIGASYGGDPIGSFADITCFSFYATKNIMMGEGGGLVTNNKKYFTTAKRFRQHGQDGDRPYYYHHIGYNYRATDIHASIGLAQMKHLGTWTKKRQENARYFSERLKHIKGIIVPFIAKESEHVFHQYTIRVTKDFPLGRDYLQAHLLKEQIQSGIYYPTILPSYNHIKKFSEHRVGDFPIAEKLTTEVLSLPVHPQLKKSELDKIIQAIGLVSK